MPIKWSQKPVWTFDLQRSSLYAVRMERVRQVGPRLPRPQLAFLNANTLAVSFADGSWQDYTVNTPRGLFHFRTFFIDTEKHALTGPTLSWPTPDDDSVLLPLAHGGFIILAGEQLVRYSSDFQVQKEAHVPPDPMNATEEEFEPYHDAAVYQIAHWRAQEDPQEQVVTLIHSVRENMSYFWLNPDSLSVVGYANNIDLPPTRTVGSFAPERMQHHGSILSASQAVTYNGRGYTMIAYDDGSWQPFCSSIEPFSQAIFASEDKLLAKYSIHKEVRYALVDNRCRVLLDLPGINNGEVDATSLSGNRIAISERSLGRTSLFTRAMPAELRIRLWDLNLDPPREIQKLAFSQKETGSEVRGMDDFAVALSPDGKLLAVLIDSTLMFYAI
ncbi:MAG: hypothetical protein WA765_17075 [Candidatus Acidiferrum sp.]